MSYSEMKEQICTNVKKINEIIDDVNSSDKEQNKLKNAFTRHINSDHNGMITDKQINDINSIPVFKEEVNASLEEVNASLEHNTNKTSAFVSVMQYKKLVVKAIDSNGVEYDDWANAIQTALNENNRIEIPSGDFGISKPIKINSYKQLRGNGRSTKIVAKVNMECVLEVGTYAESASYSDIGNLFVMGNELANYGIKIVGFTNHSCLHDFWIERCINAGLYLTKAWYCSIEKGQIRFSNNGIEAVSTSSSSETQTSNINCVDFKDLYIAFHTNNGINFGVDTGYGNMISNSTIESCDGHGIYAKRIISSLTCLNVYFEGIKKNGYQVDTGGCLNLLGGYINVDSATSNCIKVGNIGKLIVQGTSMAYWQGDLEYMIYSEAILNDITCVPMSTVTKRTIYYTGKFKGVIENVVGTNGSDFGHDMSSLTTKKINLTEMVGYGVNTNIELIRGSSVKGSVDASRVYQYIERTSLAGGWGASKIELFAKINDTSDTEKKIYEINNGYFVPQRMRLAIYNTSARPSEKDIGSVIYDHNLLKPIVWNGSNWTDFMGNVV